MKIPELDDDPWNWGAFWLSVWGLTVLLGLVVVPAAAVLITGCR